MFDTIQTMKMSIKINGQWHEVWGLMSNTIDHIVFPKSPTDIHLGDTLPNNVVKMSDDTPVIDGYDMKQLQVAFNKVKDKRDWKNPIDALVDPSEDIAVISAAITYFGCGPSDYVTVIRKGKEKIRVRAAGYYACTGT
jgi:hypothetical protein